MVNLGVEIGLDGNLRPVRVGSGVTPLEISDEIVGYRRTPTNNHELANKEYVDNQTIVAGELIGYTHLNPITATTEALTTTYDLLNTENQITFIVPDSGNVEINTQIFRHTSTNSTIVYLGLSTSSSSYVSLGNQYEKQVSKADRVDDYVLYHRWVITGLIPGTTTTYYLGAKASATVTNLKWGGTGTDQFPPFIMTAISLPGTIYQG